MYATRRSTCSNSLWWQSQGHLEAKQAYQEGRLCAGDCAGTTGADGREEDAAKTAHHIG